MDNVVWVINIRFMPKIKTNNPRAIEDFADSHFFSFELLERTNFIL